jgi:GMP synthase (glutamine-hydrolysing)
MKVVAFQHVAAEPLGYFELFFNARNIPFDYVHLYETNEVGKHDVTHFIFLGGPMSVNDEKEFPYLKEEKESIRRAVKERKKVLGICLGAQLIASAFGAPVYKYIQETGWHTLNGHQDLPGQIRPFPEEFSVFQLHGETFEIPYGGARLCSGKTVKNQAFSLKSALGLQFHLELTGDIIREWSRDLNTCSQGKIARETPRYLKKSNRLCEEICNDFIKKEVQEKSFFAGSS